MFRPAGDIRLVRTSVKVGYSHLASVLEHNKVDCASKMRVILRDTISAKGWPDCELQAYDPQTLYVHVSILILATDVYRLKR
jgi:hypothetical protein